MYKRVCAILGVGLLGLWSMGLGDPGAKSWMIWFNGLAALWSFSILIFTGDYPTREERIGRPTALGFSLLALAFWGFSSDSVAWLNWWTVAFSIAYLGLGISGFAEKRIKWVEAKEGPRADQNDVKKSRKSA